MAENIYGPQMAKNIYGSPMAKIGIFMALSWPIILLAPITLNTYALCV